MLRICNIFRVTIYQCDKNLYIYLHVMIIKQHENQPISLSILFYQHWYHLYYFSSWQAPQVMLAPRYLIHHASGWSKRCIKLNLQNLKYEKHYCLACFLQFTFLIKELNERNIKKRNKSKNKITKRDGQFRAGFKPIGPIAANWAPCLRRPHARVIYSSLVKYAQLYIYNFILNVFF